MFKKLKSFFGFEDPQAKNTKEDLKKIHIITATDFEQSLEVTEKIQNGEPVILDIHALSAEQAHRLIDFVCGSTYAINGSIQKLTQNLFLFSPESMPVAQTQMGSLNHESHT